MQMKCKRAARGAAPRTGNWHREHTQQFVVCGVNLQCGGCSAGCMSGCDAGARRGGPSGGRRPLGALIAVLHLPRPPPPPPPHRFCSPGATPERRPAAASVGPRRRAAPVFAPDTSGQMVISLPSINTNTHYLSVLRVQRSGSWDPFVYFRLAAAKWHHLFYFVDVIGRFRGGLG